MRLFSNGLLERMTVVSATGFIVLWSLALPMIAYVAWGTANFPVAFVLTAAGLLVWSLTEYGLHRFVFHWDSPSELMTKFTFLIHGNHHAVPNDPLRNLMPPIVSLSVGGVIWAISWAAFGPAGTWFVLGFMVGYVIYDLVHYACHQWPMKGRLAFALKKHHMQHHHAKQDGNYAITGMMWDRLFATRIEPQKSRERLGRLPANNGVTH